MSHHKNKERSFKSEKDMPWRVAPRLKGAVKNKGIAKNKKPRGNR